MLTSKRGVPVDDLLNHFYFNREFWHQRVRMPTYGPDAHANNVTMVHIYVAGNQVTKEFYTPDLKKYFDNFEKTCREGKFADLHDVSLHRNVGIDSKGLDLWIRLKGSVQCENIHKSMRTAMGPWGVGATVAHYLLVLIFYNYNVSTGICRKAEQNFGHPYHYLIDRLQIAVQKVYNVLVYPGISISRFLSQ